MNISDLHWIAARPASSIKDEEVAAAIELMLADPRVTKAVHVGREHGAVDGRQMIDFEMIGFDGVHSIGRVISAFQEADRLAKAEADKAAAKAARARKRDASVKAPAYVPREGADEAFDDWADGVESDISGVYGELVHNPAERARLYASYLASQEPAKKKEPRWTGPTLKGLEGSTRQKHWAAKIRDSYANARPKMDREELFSRFPKAKFWIENRDNLELAIAKETE